MDRDLIEYLQAMETRVYERMDAMEMRVYERMEAMETRLLTEFHKWASPVEMRIRSQSAALRALDMQGDSLSDAIREIERRLKELEQKRRDNEGGGPKPH